ncbi:hypothetical protein ZWY2020_049678 [Hordeum vulgare]|nr:hypothetical protein ZWY2020_049678 [Hordeum vulgare]
MESGYGKEIGLADKDGDVHARLGEDAFDSDETIDREEDGVGKEDPVADGNTNDTGEVTGLPYSWYTGSTK